MEAIPSNKLSIGKCVQSHNATDDLVRFASTARLWLDRGGVSFIGKSALGAKYKPMTSNMANQLSATDEGIFLRKTGGILACQAAHMSITVNREQKR